MSERRLLKKATGVGMAALMLALGLILHMEDG